MALLIDSSLWIDFFRRRTPTALKTAIQPWILDPAAALCAPIEFEILRHASDDERGPIEAQFATLPALGLPPDLWEQAAEFGRACRSRGITAGSLDLLIATVAIVHDAELVTFDTDFTGISEATPLRVRLLDRERR